MEHLIITTERMELVCLEPAFLQAVLEGNTAQAAGVLGAELPEDWPGEARDVLEIRLAQLRENPELQPWLLRAMVLRDAAEGPRKMAGMIGFHTAPAPEYLAAFSPAAVELGFTVATAFRRQGYAREAVLAMMHWARSCHGVTEFILSIRPDNLPSQNLAAQLGFVRIGSHLDEIDGDEDVLELKTGG